MISIKEAIEVVDTICVYTCTRLHARIMRPERSHCNTIRLWLTSWGGYGTFGHGRPCIYKLSVWEIDMDDVYTKGVHTTSRLPIEVENCDLMQFRKEEKEEEEDGNTAPQFQPREN